MKRPRYDRATRSKVWSRIKQLHREGLRNDAIAEQLMKEGYSSPSGGRLTKAYIATAKHHLGLRAYARKASTPSAKPKVSSSTESLALVELILGTSLAESQKLKVIQSLLR